MASLLIYLLHALLLPPLLVGFIRAGKAQMGNRVGPSVWQPFRDLRKLLRKGETVSETTTWVFRAAPVVQLATLAAVAMMIPWLGVPSPVAGDLFLVIYLLALGKFATSLAALDAGSAFGALGASREATVSLLSEPAMVLALAALAARAHSTQMAQVLAPGPWGSLMPVIVPLVVIALWLAAMAELARMPVDDPTTHLELTMIHEALILENSGRNLALVELGVGLKLTIMLGLVAQAILCAAPPLDPLAAWLSSLLLMFVGAAVNVMAEATLVKLRWRRIPNLLSFAVAAAVLACLIVALKG